MIKYHAPTKTEQGKLNCYPINELKFQKQARFPHHPPHCPPPPTFWNQLRPWFSHIRECLKSTLTISKQSLVQLAIICAMVINLIRSGLDMNLLKLVCIAGLAVVVCQECGRTRCAGAALETKTFTGDVFGGKHINAYIFPFANVYASWMGYFDIYISEILNLNTRS